MKRQLPQTSHDAFRAVHENMRIDHHAKIIASLEVLGSAIYEEIATHACMEKNQVSRRLIELEREGIVYKPGTTKKTKSNREAYEYCLAKSGERTTLEKTRGKSTSDHAKEIIQSTKQPELF